MNKIPKISVKLQLILKSLKNIFGHFILIKNNLETIQKIFRSIITIQKHGAGWQIYILVVQNIQYSEYVSWCGLVVSARGHSQQGQIKVPASQTVTRTY